MNEKERCHEILDWFLDGAVMAQAAINIEECNQGASLRPELSHLIKMVEKIFTLTMFAVVTGDEAKVSAAVGMIGNFRGWGEAALEASKERHNVSTA